jgi:hypothetical protein
MSISARMAGFRATKSQVPVKGDGAMQNLSVLVLVLNSLLFSGGGSILAACRRGDRAGFLPSRDA